MTSGGVKCAPLEDETYTAGLLNGILVDRSFDTLHRRSGVSVPSLSSVAYSYDSASRLDTVMSGPNTVTYGYLANSPLVETVTFKNNGATRLATTKSFDKLDRLSAITNQPSASGLPPIAYSYTYNNANQRTRVTREDNAYWSYGYDPLAQVTSGKKFLASNDAVLGHDYAWTFDDIGNRKTASTNGQTSTFIPDTLNQYVQRTVPGAIDVLGAADFGATVTVAVNSGTPQSTTRQGELFYKQVTVNNASAPQNGSLKITGMKNLVGPNGEDAVTEITKTAFVAQTPESFTHDVDGNLTLDARWSYTWDGENRLIAMETSSSAATAGIARRKLEFDYDGRSRRVSKKVFNWSGSAWTLTSHTVFVYDGWNLLAELNALSSNAAVRTYVWGLDLSGSLQGAGGVGGLLCLTDGESTTHLAAHDGNGNVGGLVKASDGALTAGYDYNAFGELVQLDGPAAESNPFRFSTKYADVETGLLYYGYRYYDPSTGRWPSRDPIEEMGGLNLFGFVNNNPVNAWDYLGLVQVSPEYKMVPIGPDEVKWSWRPGQGGGATEVRGPEVSCSPCGRSGDLNRGIVCEIKGRTHVYIYRAWPSTPEGKRLMGSHGLNGWTYILGHEYRHVLNVYTIYHLIGGELVQEEASSNSSAEAKRISAKYTKRLQTMIDAEHAHNDAGTGPHVNTPGPTEWLPAPSDYMNRQGHPQEGF